MGIFQNTQGQLSLHGPIWLNFYLNQGYMAVLVTCKKVAEMNVRNRHVVLSGLKRKYGHGKTDQNGHCVIKEANKSKTLGSQAGLCQAWGDRFILDLRFTRK